MDIYRRLLKHFGKLNWWPGENPFEVMVGAVLTQNTSWRNVEKAIKLLKENGLSTPEAIISAQKDVLLSALKPSGYFNVKAKRLTSLCQAILDKGSGGLYPDILKLPEEELRETLLGVKGVGPETADSIVLYAANYPSFVVDTYTRRLLSRHGLISGNPPYEAIRRFFMDNIPKDAVLYNEYHALIVACGHHFCSPKNPSCSMCPLGKDPFLNLH
ncbi:MAG: endonuclease III domain-containing protein [Deltaproteobacteria bacterium]|jgi:endonuclease-3 related protein|nr:endonuclease III domain-containing protein [Deltaproteobacteria bacterium]